MAFSTRSGALGTGKSAGGFITLFSTFSIGGVTNPTIFPVICLPPALFAVMLGWTFLVSETRCGISDL
jgi:hypothetical protein